MATYDNLPVYKASYDLLVEIFQFVKTFNKEYKYTILKTDMSQNKVYVL